MGDAMQANPAAAVSGLKSGIADGLGVEPSGVEITRTVPDLLGGRRLAEGRRLDATSTVNFDVAVADSAVASRVDSLTSGDSSVVESMTSAVESGLAAQNIQVTIVSVDASLWTSMRSSFKTLRYPRLRSERMTLRRLRYSQTRLT